MTRLSIVIPALDEAAKIGRDVEAAGRFAAGLPGDGEVIVVDDGSADGTAEAAGSAGAAPDFPKDRVSVRVIRFERNRGKGAAVKAGVAASTGDVVIVADSGGCVPFANAAGPVERIRSGTLDVAMGSRRHPATVVRRDRPLRRRVLSRLFHAAARGMGVLPRGIRDSQCGFKIYRGDAARRLFAACRTSGYLYELEVLRAAVRSGLRVEEVPVEWTCDPDTRLRPGSDFLKVLGEMGKIRKEK